MTDYRDAALELARQGVAVFPCNEDKSPRTPRGFHDASTDPVIIRGWDWNGGGMIGAAIADGMVVVDVDPRNGGDATLRALEAAGREFPHTRTVRTMSGGEHLYFRVPEGVSLRGKLGTGVDVKRAGKGYVVVPPSPGYTVHIDLDVAPAPEWLLDELTVPERPTGLDAATVGKFFPWEVGSPYGLGAMERELGRLATAAEGGRNDALNRAAFALAQLAAGGELDEERAKGDLMEVALRIGLEPAEAKATILSGWSSGEQEPRQAPEREDEPRDAEGLPDAGHAGPEDEAHFWVDWSADEPEPPFYLHPILPKNAYVLVYGATEAAKSMTWVGLLAEGSRRGIRTSVYSLENPPHTDRDRLRRWSPDPDCFRLTNAPLDLNDPRQLEAMVERERAWGTDVILIDTYSHAFNSRSEDGNAKAIEFARRIRYVMHEVGCSIVVVDHTGYEREDEPRDASAKRQQVDVAIFMKKRGEWRPGSPARFLMTNKKSARFGNPFLYNGEIDDAPGDSRGLELGWQGEAPRWEPTP